MIQALLCIQRGVRALVQGSTYNMSCYPDCEHHVSLPCIVHFRIAYISRGCGLYMAVFMNSSGKSLHSAHAVYVKCSNPRSSSDSRIGEASLSPKPSKLQPTCISAGYSCNVMLISILCSCVCVQLQFYVAFYYDMYLVVSNINISVCHKF